MNIDPNNDDSGAQTATIGLGDRGNLTPVETSTIFRHQNSNGDEPLPGSLPDKAAGKKRHARYLMIAMNLVPALAGVAFYYARFIAPFESTDDAFIEAHITPIAPQVTGRVSEVLVSDNQLVKPGDLLLQIDPSDY